MKVWIFLLLVGCKQIEAEPTQGSQATDHTAPILLVPGQDVELEVRGDGLFALAGTPLPTDDALLARLTAWHTASPTARIHIDAHPATVHGRLVRAYELVQLAGIRTDHIDLLPVHMRVSSTLATARAP